MPVFREGASPDVEGKKGDFGAVALRATDGVALAIARLALVLLNPHRANKQGLKGQNHHRSGKIGAPRSNKNHLITNH